MSTDFPATGIDSYTRPSSTDRMDATDVEGDVVVDNCYDAIEALEAKVGVDSSAVTTSHDYKLSGVTGTDVAASLTGTETLTNKTLTDPTISLANNDPYSIKDSGGTSRGVLNVDGSDNTELGNANLTGFINFNQIWDSAVQPACKLYLSSNQSIPDSDQTEISWDSEEIDVGGMHEGVTNPGRITIQKTGLYLVGYHISWENDAANRRYIALLLNGVNEQEYIINQNPVATGNTQCGTSRIEELSADDYLTLEAYQNTGGALDVTTLSRFWVFKLA